MLKKLLFLFTALMMVFAWSCDCVRHCGECDDSEECCDDRVCRPTTAGKRCMDSDESMCIGTTFP